MDNQSVTVIFETPTFGKVVWTIPPTLQLALEGDNPDFLRMMGKEEKVALAAHETNLKKASDVLEAPLLSSLAAVIAVSMSRDSGLRETMASYYVDVNKHVVELATKVMIQVPVGV